jgi:hypothetical protein
VFFLQFRLLFFTIWLSILGALLFAPLSSAQRGVCVMMILCGYFSVTPGSPSPMTRVGSLQTHCSSQAHLHSPSLCTYYPRHR